MKIKFKLNDKTIDIEENPLKRLIDFLRNDKSLTGTKEGCGEGECGACSVFINGKLINSCLVALGSLNNSEIITIEHFRNTKRYKILEESFNEAGAVQCGFCIPGFIMAADYLLRNNSNPTENEIREGISGNLCRCTGYEYIVDAIKLASKRGDGIW